MDYMRAAASFLPLPLLPPLWLPLQLQLLLLLLRRLLLLCARPPVGPAEGEDLPGQEPCPALPLTD
jgi:hypothetical protein